MTYDTPSFTITLSDEGLLRCEQKAPAVLRKMRSDGQGGLTIERVTLELASKSDAELIRAHNSAPTAVMAYRGNREWEVDLDAGMQRFHGHKGDHVVKAGLRNTGLTVAQIKEILAAAKKHKATRCPRYY